MNGCQREGLPACAHTGLGRTTAMFPDRGSTQGCTNCGAALLHLCFVYAYTA